MKTLGNVEIDPLNPLPDQFDIETIADCLSKLCRFGGHCKGFYSVAEHSCNVLDLGVEMAKKEGTTLSREDKLQFLLHDGTEAYVGDLIAPVKNLIPEYKRIESLFWKAITTKFNIKEKWHSLLDKADKVAYGYESLALRKWSTVEELEGHIPYKIPEELNIQVRCLDIDLSRLYFLNRFNELIQDE